MSDTYSSSMAASTGTWNITSGGSAANAEANPMTFYKSMSLSNESWASLKTVNDPCPAGWRVPDGGTDGVWSKALGSSSFFSSSSLYSSTNKGMNFSDKFGAASTIWYPATGERERNDGNLYSVGYHGSYWSTSPSSDNFNFVYLLLFNGNGDVYPSFDYPHAYGFSVRCQKIL